MLLNEQRGLQSRLFQEFPSSFEVVLVHLTAMLQDFPIHRCTFLFRARIGLFRADIRKEALLVHLGRKVMIVDEGT